MAQSCHKKVSVNYEYAAPVAAKGFVGIDSVGFVLDGEPWFPLMLNYKAEIRRVGDSIEVVPASYYHVASENSSEYRKQDCLRTSTMREHFDTIAAWGFNAIRLCLDVLDRDMDSAAMMRATRRAIEMADSVGLHVMLLTKAPFDPYWQSYTKGLLRTLGDMPALWAYDFMNEPLYFDPVPDRPKEEAIAIVGEWCSWVRQYAPHQLFTVSTAEPIEVFEWDPSMLPIDFVEMHTYHPLRVCSEMWWYSHYCGKPWMVGETGLPADNDSVPYLWQADFMWWTHRFAEINGAAGYGWWEFQDCPAGVNFEAQYTGLCDKNGIRKPAANMVIELRRTCMGMCDADGKTPVNYYNMLAYSNIRLTGKVVDNHGNPVEGAVIRGWNDDWLVGMNTYSDREGRFTLFSNDYNVHFEVSAPGMSREKFDRRNIKYKNIGNIDPNNLPDRQREYQQIDYRPYLNHEFDIITPFSLFFDSTHFNRYSLDGEMGTIKLKPIR